VDYDVSIACFKSEQIEITEGNASEAMVSAFPCLWSVNLASTANRVSCVASHERPSLARACWPP